MKTTTTPTRVFFEKGFKENFDNQSIKKALPNYHKLFLSVFCVMSFFITSTAFAQDDPVLPNANSCTSKDLVLVEASLPPTNGACDNCTPGDPQIRTLYLSIDNKTGSKRTSFAFWGNLEVYRSDGTLKTKIPIDGCNGPILPTSINKLDFGDITYECGESLKLTDLFLAWSTSNKKQTCPLESSLIAPKCGTVPSVQIFTGLDAIGVPTNATCTSGGSILVSPFGGKAPYIVAIGNDEKKDIPTGGTANFTNLPSGSYLISLTDADECTNSKSVTVGSSAAPIAEAGTAFTKTCTSNATGGTIGVASESGFTYSWSPTSSGLSNDAIANPTANPSVTTTYTVRKTNDSTGCYDDDSVTVTVDITAPTSEAGGTKELICTTLSVQLDGSGDSANLDKVLTYLWSGPASYSNSTATPSVSAPGTYTLRVTDTDNGCYAEDTVEITQDITTPTAEAGGTKELTCTTTSVVLDGSGDSANLDKVLTYLWSGPASYSNSTATPSVSAPGTYTLRVTDTDNGCYAEDTVEITQDITTPTAEAGGTKELTCTTTSVVLDGSGDSANLDKVLTYLWSGPASYSNSTATPSVSAPGTYTLRVTDTDNGCYAEDTVEITQDITTPTAEAGGTKELTCTTTSVVLDGSGDSANLDKVLTYLWSGPASYSNSTATPSVSAPGTYTLRVTDTDNGCYAEDTVEITQDITTPTAEAGGTKELTCTTTSVVLDGSGDSANLDKVLTYLWSGPASYSNSTATPSVSAPGTYTLRVTDTDNGCYAEDTVEITQDITIPDAPTICVVQPSLCGPETGSITILAPLGAEYDYSIDDGTTWQSEVFFDDLNAGSNPIVKVRNKNTGCVSSTADCDDSDCDYVAPLARTSSETKEVLKSEPIEELVKSEISVKAYPNPFNNDVSFNVNVPEASQGSLELVNLLGQKVKTVFNGKMEAGVNTFKVNLPAQQTNMLIYVLRVGDKRITGKLIQKE